MLKHYQLFSCALPFSRQVRFYKPDFPFVKILNFLIAEIFNEQKSQLQTTTSTVIYF
jgi:hypothetical protein